eukprot:2444939-Pyramimonas_sp.AAC.1
MFPATTSGAPSVSPAPLPSVALDALATACALCAAAPSHLNAPPPRASCASVLPTSALAPRG